MLLPAMSSVFRSISTGTKNLLIFNEKMSDGGVRIITIQTRKLPSFSELRFEIRFTVELFTYISEAVSL